MMPTTRADLRPRNDQHCHNSVRKFVPITSIITFAVRFAIVLTSRNNRSVAAASAFLAHAQKQPFLPPSRCSTIIATSTCAWASTTSTNIMLTASPPVARRDEDGNVLAGVAPEGWDPKISRQSESSEEKLLDPPVPVPYVTRLGKICSIPMCYEI